MAGEMTSQNLTEKEKNINDGRKREHYINVKS